MYSIEVVHLPAHERGPFFITKAVYGVVGDLIMVNDNNPMVTRFLFTLAQAVEICKDISGMKADTKYYETVQREMVFRTGSGQQVILKVKSKDDEVVYSMSYYPNPLR